MTILKDPNSHSEEGLLEKYMEFRLGEELFAIPLLIVKEVIDIPRFTSVPYTPEYFLGIINLRGQVLSVIDLSKKMRIHSDSEKNESAVIILDLYPLTLGVLVDSINSVLPIANGELSPAPGEESRLDSQFILGIYRREENLTLILDIKNLLTPNDVSLISERSQSS